MKLKLQPIKILCLLLSIGAIALFFTACKDDEGEQKTIPTVETIEITDVTTEFATAKGEITDDGNATVTTAGFVYSSTNTTPTLEDGQKVEITDTDGEFTAELDELTSGTTYHVRAFATNSKGTGYGDVVDFESGNAPPTATNVTVTGPNEVNKELTADYDYNDAEGNTEGTSTYKWYMANDATGTGEVVIAGATELTYTIEEAAQGKYIRFGVTPKAGNGPDGSKTGAEVKSSFTAAVGEATTVTFMYRGNEVTYGIYISQTTGEKWLDRNLGAPNAPTSVSDYANYGDLFQWGRPDDGHQVVTRTSPANADATGSTTTTTVSAGNVPPNGNFILNTGNPFDWKVPQNPALWQGVGGANNPCPTGWRLPTVDEFNAEALGLLDGNFVKLNITRTGYREGGAGAFEFTDSQGLYWTSSTDNSNGFYQAVRARMTNGSGYTIAAADNRTGMAVRCIKD